MGKRKRNNWDTARKNDRTFLHYYNRLMEIAITMFKWKGLPVSVDVRYLELQLFSKGYCFYFEDDVLKDMLALGGTMTGKLNVYGVPTQRLAIGQNASQYELSEENSVVIYNNTIRTGCMIDVELYADKLYEIDMIIRTNIKAQKTPVLIQATENQRLVMLNLYQQYEGNAPYIFGDDKLQQDSLQVLKTDAPFIASDLQDLKDKIWNEALTWLGVSNVSYAKKERMIADEVSRGMGGTVASSYSRLLPREQAAKLMSEKWGTEITVVNRIEEEQKGVENNGNIHDTTTFDIRE